jgi:hypothetical protein
MRQRARLRKLAQLRPWGAWALLAAFVVAQLLLPATVLAQEDNPPSPLPMEAAGETAALGQTVKLIATKDTFIASNQPGENFGNLDNLDTGWYGAFGAVRPLIKFDLGNIPGNARVYGAQLVLYLNFALPSNDGNMVLDAARATQSWSEGGATWMNAASIGGPQFRLGSVSTQSGWASFDLTNQVQNWVNGQGNNGLMIIGDETPSLSRARIFSSRHVGGQEPYLLVNYECDTLAPVSQMGSLAANSPASFTVNWSGQDRAPSGCQPTGIRRFTVQYRVNGGSWVDWHSSTTRTSDTFTAPVSNGARVDFRVWADDNAGNVEQTPSNPQASTVIITQAPAVAFTALPAITNVPSFTINWTAVNAPIGVASYDVQYQMNGGAWLDLLVQTQQTTYFFNNAQSGTTYGFRARARDSAGNVGTFPSVAQVQTTVELYPNARMTPFNPSIINSTSPVTTSFELNWTGSTPPGTTITTYQIYFRVFNLQGVLVQDWNASAPWQTFDGNTTTATFPLQQLGLGDGLYQFQATATNTLNQTTPFGPNGVEATMIVDMGDTIKPQLYNPVVRQ